MKEYVFIGGTKRGYELIKELIKDFGYPELAFVLKEDAHESTNYSSSIAELLEGNCIYSVTKKLKVEDYEKLNGNRYYFAIVCGWRTVIDLDKMAYSFKYGLLAAHDSLLPKYRGFAPTNWAIINGETECGVSIFKINKGEVDSGDIYSQKKVKVEEHDDINTIMSQITLATIAGYKDVFNNIENITPIVQNEEEASYTCKRRPSDGVINWRNSSLDIYNLMRSLYPPYPSSFTWFNGKKLFIHKAELGRFNKRNFIGRIPGKVIAISDAGIEVLCGEGSILITLVEYEDVILKPKQLFKSITYTFDNEHNH